MPGELLVYSENGKQEGQWQWVFVVTPVTSLLGDDIAVLFAAGVNNSYDGLIDKLRREGTSGLLEVRELGTFVASVGAVSAYRDGQSPSDLPNPRPFRPATKMQ